MSLFHRFDVSGGQKVGSSGMRGWAFPLRGSPSRTERTDGNAGTGREATVNPRPLLCDRRACAVQRPRTRVRRRRPTTGPTTSWAAWACPPLRPWRPCRAANASASRSPARSSTNPACAGRRADWAAVIEVLSCIGSDTDTGQDTELVCVQHQGDSALGSGNGDHRCDFTAHLAFGDPHPKSGRVVLSTCCQVLEYLDLTLGEGHRVGRVDLAHLLGGSSYNFAGQAQPGHVGDIRDTKCDQMLPTSSFEMGPRTPPPTMAGSGQALEVRKRFL